MLAQNQEAPMEITLNMNALGGMTRDWIQDEARRTGASVDESLSD
jgi:hypothetical protein